MLPRWRLDGKARRLLRLNLLAGVGSRVALTVYWFVISRWVVATFGDERYGIYAYVVAMGQLTTFLDLGVGNGALNRIAEANARDDRIAVSRTFGAMFWLLTVIAGLSFVAAIGIGSVFSFGELMKSSNPAVRAETSTALTTYLLITIVGLPLSSVQRLQVGTHESFLNDCFQTLGLVASAVAARVVLDRRPDLSLVIGITTAAPLVFWLLNGIVQMYAWRPWLRVGWHTVSPVEVRLLLRSGSWFTLLNANGVIFFLMDQFLTARLLGPIESARLSAATRPFGLVLAITQAAMLPLWPAYRDAVANRKRIWVKNTFKRSLITTTALSLSAAATLVPLEAPLVKMWLSKGTLVPDMSLSAALAAWTVVLCIGVALAAYYNACGLLRFQLTVSVISTVLCAILKAIVCQYAGLSAMVWTGVLVYCAGILLPSWLCRRYILAHA